MRVSAKKVGWSKCFLVASFFWNSEREGKTRIVSHESIGPIGIAVLESRLGSLAFESDMNAQEIMQQLCGEENGEGRIILHIPTPTEVRDGGSAGEKTTTPVFLSAFVESISRPDLCATGLSKALNMEINPLDS